MALVKKARSKLGFPDEILILPIAQLCLYLKSKVMFYYMLLLVSSKLKKFTVNRFKTNFDFLRINLFY